MELVGLCNETIVAIALTGEFCQSLWLGLATGRRSFLRTVSGVQDLVSTNCAIKRQDLETNCE